MDACRGRAALSWEGESVADSSLRIGVNALFVRHGRVGGAEQMLTSLLLGLDGAVEVGEAWRVFSREPLVLTAPLTSLRQHVLPDRASVNRIVYEAVALPRLHRPDVWLHTNYFTPPASCTRAVTVIHDAQYAALPENFSVQKRAWLKVAHARTMATASRVVAISEFTRTHLIDLHGAGAAEKLRVIPNPVSFQRLHSDTAPTSIPAGAPYILSVAAQYRHKNLRTLLDAHANVRRTHDVRLVLVGQGRDQLVGRASAEDLIPDPAQAGVLFTGFVTDAELGALYERAAVFAFPSLFEGFGLPVIEALGKRVPTVTTRCGAIPEVGGPHPIYVEDPTSPEEFASALRRALEDPDTARPTEAAAEQLRARYAPENIGQQYADLLREVAG